MNVETADKHKQKKDITRTIIHADSNNTRSVIKKNNDVVVHV